MVSLASADALFHAIARSSKTSLLAYTLRDGPLLDALVSAARRGADVHVRLAVPSEGSGSPLGRWNARLVRTLNGAGVAASLQRSPLLHAKAIVAGDRLFLDDTNFTTAGTLVRDDSRRHRRTVETFAAQSQPAEPARAFAFEKRAALEFEAALLLRARRGDRVDVETESFGFGNAVARALGTLLRRGVRVRLLAAARDAVAGTNDRRALTRLARAGAAVRLCGADEKFAIAGDRAWIGSANATAAAPGQVDWGMRTTARAVVRHEAQSFAQRWKSARAIRG